MVFESAIFGRLTIVMKVLQNLNATYKLVMKILYYSIIIS